MTAISARALGEATVQELREALRGDVVTPADPDYDEAAPCLERRTRRRGRRSSSAVPVRPT